MKASVLPVLLCAALLGGCDQPADSTPSAPRAALTVTTDTVQTRTLAQTLDAQGQIAPWQEGQISARVNGLPLIEVLAEVGDRVQKDQVLARFDDRSVQADLQQARANLAQASANARQAAATFARSRRMQGKGAVSEQDLQLAQTQAEMAAAQQDMAQAQVSTQEIRLYECTVRAVDDGLISARAATLGQVTAAGTELFRLIRQNRLEWHAELSARQLAQIAPGQAVTISLPDGSQVAGRVRQLAPALDSQSRLGRAYVALENGSGARAGMFATGTLQLAQQDTPVVPADAVVLRDGRSTVFRLESAGLVTQVQVETGNRQGNLIEIRAGLNTGERIVVRGAGFLADGDRVREAGADITAAHTAPAGSAP